MNKYEKAFKIATTIVGYSTEEVNEAKITLQELVDKETPMKPIATEYFTKRYGVHNSYVFPIYICPICYKSFSDDGPKYCPGCGQKLDWSDENAT